MLKGIIFDLDGVLVDSEPVHFLAYKQSFEKYGIDLSKENYLRFGVSRGDRFLVEKISQKYKKKIDLEEIRKLKKEYFGKKIGTNLRLREGILETISLLSNKCKLAIASSSRRETIERVLRQFEMRKYFKAIVGGDEVESVKPEPDIYLRVLDLLSFSSEQCIAVEDSQTGLRAAKGAGLRCVACPTEYTNLHDLSRADFLAKDINMVREIILKELD